MNLKPKKIKHVNISSDTSDAAERKSNERRILGVDTSFEIIEAYKSTRTNVMFSLNNEKGCKKIVITSPTSGEGKTTSCINLACTFAETGAKVLLVDCDLRAPRLHKYLRLNNDLGLSTVLAGFDVADNCIKATDRENLDCITSGPIPPNPVELVSMDTMKSFIEEMEQKYDYIFIDTPPVNIVTEALIISKYATGVIIVTRQKYTMYKMVEKAISSLKFAEAKIAGFIINDVEENKYAYGGYKGHGNYRYGGNVSYGYYGAEAAGKFADNKKKSEKKAAAKEKEAK